FVNSGNPIAGFLLGAVSHGDVDFRTVSAWYPRQNAYVAHAGDTWKMKPKLTVDYGLRWDVFTPFREKFNRFSFFDPVVASAAARSAAGWDVRAAWRLPATIRVRRASAENSLKRPGRRGSRRASASRIRGIRRR